MSTPVAESIHELYLRYRVWLWIAQALLVFLIGFGAAWLLKQGSSPTADSNADATAQTTEDASTSWTCSMHPQIRRNKPGKCPICGMELVPVKKTTMGMRTVSISPNARELLQIETSPVERRYVTAQVRMVGTVEYDETRLSHITAWVSGRLDRLYVDYEGIQVKEGDHLVYIYSEQLYSAQEELLQAIQFQQNRQDNPSTLIRPIDLVASAREKLRLLGLTIEQIAEIEQRGSASEHLTIYSPSSGIVVEKEKQEGDRVRTGDRIYTVADLSQLWVLLDAYESDLPWLRFGQSVEFTTEAYPGEVFEGQIAFIDPVLNQDTRTVKVRVNVANVDGRLKPEMFVRAVVKSQVAAGGRVLDPSLAGKWISPMHPEIVRDAPGACDVCGMPLVRAESLGYVTAEPEPSSKPLVIPVSAALVTGTRAIVYVQIPNAETPTYEGREVVLGSRAGDYYLVRSGVSEGELVVSRGNFKLDSALQISAKPSMMTPQGGGGGGHHHGSSPKHTSQASVATEHSMTLSQAVLAQLESLDLAFRRITQGVEQADLASSRHAFASFARSLETLGSQAFPQDMRIMWDELKMLLTNDAIEGQDASSQEEIDRVYRSLRSNWQRTRKQMQMEDPSHQALSGQLEFAPEFLSQLPVLWTAYRPLGIALAGDDFLTAKQQGSAMTTALQRIDATSLDGAAAQAWARERANLEAINIQLKDAKDLAQLRVAFALLSDEVTAIYRLFGLHSELKLYELHCPMAFEGRGAVWLQDHDEPQNPYFGASMLRCADRVERLPPMPASKSTGSQHDLH